MSISQLYQSLNVWLVIVTVFISLGTFFIHRNTIYIFKDNLLQFNHCTTIVNFLFILCNVLIKLMSFPFRNKVVSSAYYMGEKQMTLQQIIHIITKNHVATVQLWTLIIEKGNCFLLYK